jgi:acetylornithine deacetylase/succinyl-diaminopimelate desuccinylase-like protein
MDIASDIAVRFEPEVLASLGDYIAIPALSPDFDSAWKRTGAIDMAAQHLFAWAMRRDIEGLRGSIREIDGRTPVIVLEIDGTDGVDQPGSVLLYGHLDKQPPLGDWSEGLSPFKAVRRDDLLYGRGSVDDGYALYAALLAIEALQRNGQPHGRLVVLIEASEESGSPDLRAHLDALGDVLGDVSLVLCLDSGALSYDRLWITNSLRGNISMSLRVDVLTQGVHSGEASGVVPSSFRVIRQLLDRIEDAATGDVLLPELNAQPPDHHLTAALALSTALDDPLSRHFPTVEGLELLGRDGADRLIRQSWAPTVSITGFDGAPAPKDAGNVLRASTTVKLSVRTPPSVDAHIAQAALIEALTVNPPYGARITVDPETVAQGWMAAPRSEWLDDAIVQASRAAFGQDPGFLGEGGSIPFLAELGHRFPQVEMVATGALGPGSNAHGPDESLHLPTAIGVSTSVAYIVRAHALR